MINQEQREFADLERLREQYLKEQPEESNPSMYSQDNQENIAKYQLNMDGILERAERLLRGDKVKLIDGNITFVKCEIEDQLFNEKGVQEIMRILTTYLNPNTILSNYSEGTINWKLLDFGKTLSDLIFMKYQEFGLDTVEKRKIYPSIVLTIVDMVHSSYLRALNGEERRTLRQIISISQTEPIMNSQMGQMQMPKQKSIFKPWTWS